MPRFEAGTAYVQVKPSLRRFQERIQAEVRRVPDAEVQITARTNAAQVRGELAAATRNPPTAKLKVEVDRSSLAKAEAAVAAAADRLSKARDTEADAAGRVRVAETSLAAVRKKSSGNTARVTAAEERLEAAKRKSAQASQDVATIEKQVDAARAKVRDVEVKIGAAVKRREWDQASEHVGAFAAKAQRQIDTALRSIPAVELPVRSTEAERRLQAIRGQIARLSDQRIGIDISAEEAHAEIRRLRGELLEVSRDRTATVQVKADAAAAAAALSAVDQQARRVDGRRVNISVNANDVSRAITLIGLLTVAIVGVAAVVAPAAAAVAGLGAIGGAAAQGITALAVGFSGVGDAVKALSDAETKAAAGTAVSAAARVNSAQAIVAAHRQVERAVTAADRAAIQGGQQVADARRAVSDSYAQGARQIAAAERTYRQAVVASTDAQLELNRARLDAIERLEDLRLSLRGVAIDEREALLDLKDAQTRLNQGIAAGVAGDELERLTIAVDRAQLSLDQTQERFGDLRKESTEYARSGIEGSREVVAAQKQIAAAVRGVQDSEAALQLARSDSRRDTERAEEQLRRTIQQTAWAQVDAAAAVGDAARALSNTYEDTGTQGATSLNKVREVMAGLSPEAQRFAKFLVGEVIPGLHGIRDGVQASLLPRLETSLRNLNVLAPDVTDGLAGTGVVLGDLAVKGSEMVTSGPFREDFRTLMAGNNRILRDFGEAVLFGFDAMRTITVGALPLGERFSTFTLNVLASANAFVQAKRRSGELDVWMQKMGDTLAMVGHVAGQLVTAVVQISDALGPLGGIVLRTVGNFAELLGHLAQAHPLITQVVAVGLIAGSMFTTLGKAIVGMGASLALATAGFKRVLPAAIEARLAGVVAGMNSAAGAAGGLAVRLTGSADVGGRVVGVGQRLSSTFSRVAANLPVAGAAALALTATWDALTVSTGEAADAINKGGIEAAKARNKIDILERGTAGFHAVLGPLITTQEEATAAARDQRAALGPLARAQMDVERASNDYDLILRDNPATSDAATAAAKRLQVAQNALGREQRQASEATKSHTDRLIEQQGVMQGGLAADLAYRQALEDVNEQLVELAGVTSLNTEQSLELESSIQRVAEAAKQRALANYKDKTSQDAVLASNQAYDQAILDLITTAGTLAPPALTAYISKLTESQLTAIGARVETDHLGNRVIALPNGKRIEISSTAPQAQAQVEALHKALDNLPRNTELSVLVRANLDPKSDPAVRPLVGVGGGIGGILERAEGGPVVGGIPGRDSVPLLAMPGEYVLSAPAVAALGGTLAVDRFHDAAASRGVPRYAAGGPVGSAKPAAGTATTAPAKASVTVPLDPLAVAGDVEVLTTTLQELQTTALRPVATELTKVTDPAMVGFGATTQAAWKQAATQVTASTTAQSTQMALLATRLGTATTGMATNLTRLRSAHASNWAQITAVSGSSIAQIVGPQFAGLHQGLDLVQVHAARMSGVVGTEFGRIPALTAHPLRSALQGPLNAGLVPAWNAIDRFFALGRPLGPVPIGFDTGGRVPGVGRGDVVPAMLEPGEFVVSRPAVATVGMDNLDRWHQAARRDQSTSDEGMFRVPGFEAGGAVGAAMNVARRAVGKPYVWGATGPNSFDCSGLWSAIVNTALGRSPYQRRFTTSSFAGNRGAGGLVPGLSSVLGVGVQTGHMAGTLAGTAFEATPPRVLGPGARGATSFPMRFSLPSLGGRFVEGPGGAGFDVAAYLDQQLANARRLAADIVRLHGPGNPAVAATRAVTDAIDGAKEFALKQVVYTGGGGPNKDVGRRMSAARGWVGGQWSALEELWDRESNWNHLARNPSSGAYGIPQALPANKMATAGPDWQTNPATQIRWGLDYIAGRYGTPQAALAFHDRRNWYRAGGPVHTAVMDSGGWLPPGANLIWNGTGDRERVTPGAEWRELTSAVRGGDGPLIGSITQHITSGQPDEIIRSAMFEARRARNAGRYARAGS